MVTSPILTAFLKTDGRLYFCDDLMGVPPIQIGTDSNWSDISVDSGSIEGHIVAVKTTGTLWDIYNSDAVWTVTQIGVATDWASVVVGGGYFIDPSYFAIKTSGTLWSWGNNDSGQLGLGSVGGSFASPQQVGTATNWSSLVGTGQASFVVNSNKDLYGCGTTSFNLFGTGNATESSLVLVVGGKVKSSYASTINVYASLADVSISVVPDQYEYVELPLQSGNPGFFMKSTSRAYVYSANAGTLTLVTDADYPATTVPGLAFLDGVVYVMTPSGSIYGSDLYAPLSWSALNVIQCQAEPDNGKLISRLNNYVVGFGVYSTEFFYDAGNPTGSALLPVSSSQLEIGCASATSLAQLDNTLYIIGVTRQRGRCVYSFQGTVPTPISDAYVNRILNADDLANVFAYCVKSNGHTFYVLTLKTTGVTLVYDAMTGAWSEWSSSTPGAVKPVASLTQDSGIATVTAYSHGLADGDPVQILGAVPDGYNLLTNAMVVSSDVFTYLVPADLVTPATGDITATPFKRSYFSGIHYIVSGGKDMIQDESNGYLYAMDTGLYQDVGNPIDVLVRTTKLDGGDNKRKHMASLEVVSDKVSSMAYVRYTDDDYQTYNKYRPVSLAAQRSRLNRLGSFRRRAFEIRHSSDTALRMESLEVTVVEGLS